VVTDEVNEPWLDEAPPPRRGADHDDVMVQRLHRPVRHSRRLDGGEPPPLPERSNDPVAKPSHAMLDVDSYQAVYAKTALVLKTLQAMLGDDVLRDTLRVLRQKALSPSDQVIGAS
jgi:hypothetical protein